MEETDYEQLGIEDGAYDRDNKMPYHSSYGASVDLDELDVEALEAYDLGYNTAADSYDISDLGDDEYGEDDYSGDIYGCDEEEE